MATILIMLLWLSAVNGGFIETPSFPEVPIGADATCRCRHQTADIIRWRVNNDLLGRSPPPDITPGTTHDGNSNFVDTLTITARPEYNRTMVVCVARFDDERSDELTDPAILIVLMNTTNTMDTTDGEFLLSPVSQNITVDTMAVFQCQHPTADGINWRINGTTLRDLPEGFSTDRSDDGVFILTITGLPDYNGTVIECVAFFSNSPSEETNPAIMRIQGSLGSVTEVHRSTSTLTWIPPPSLDLTNADPDIAYCVDIYNITCGRRDLIISDCNVTEPSYTSDDIAPDGYIYEYTVTPRSNVEGARNGTPSRPLRNLLPKFSMDSSLLSIKDANNRNYRTTIIYQRDDVPVPSTYTLSLKSLDDLDDMPLVETNAAKHDISITLDVVPGLPLKRLWNCTVLAYGCQDHPVLTGAELSTHDIQNISVSSPFPDQVRVTGDFIEGSTATGVLIIVYSQSNDSDIHYKSCEREGLIAEANVVGLTGSQYGMSVFVLDDGLPFSQIATSSQLLHILNASTEQGTTQQEEFEYELHPTSTGVCITCTFLDSSITDCVAVVHQRISQLSSSGLMNIESSHKFNRSGDTAYGCIEGVNLTVYQVGVISGSQGFVLPSTKPGLCSLWCTTGIVLGIIVGMSLILIISLICLYIARIKANDTSPDQEVAVDMKRCTAYEVTTLAKQKVVMETNPAYEHVRVN